MAGKCAWWFGGGEKFGILHSMLGCDAPSEEVEAVYAEAATRWDVQVDERTATRSSIYISGCYWE